LEATSVLLLLRSELFRLNRRWMPRILLGISIVIIAFLYLLFWIILRTDSGTSTDLQRVRENLRLAAVRGTGLGFVSTFGTTVVIILTASLIGSEFGWGTIRTILPRARSRSAFLTAKVLTAILFAVAVTVIGAIVAVLASGFVTGTEQLPSSLGPDGALRFAESTGRCFYTMLPYLALTLCITVWTRSVAAGIGGGISFLFLQGAIVELISLAGGPFDRLPGALIDRNVSALLAANSAGLPDSYFSAKDAMPGAWQATGVLAIYTVVFLALSYYRLSRRDSTVE
jgi:ABC-type transport system involved in multi-copper enzyme maturation permease subunit